MLKVVRFLFALECRGNLLAAGLLTLTTSVCAQAPAGWLTAFKSVGVSHANINLVTVDRRALIEEGLDRLGEIRLEEDPPKEVEAPDSTPTFSAAHPLFLIAAKDFVAPDSELDNNDDKDRAKLKG